MQATRRVLVVDDEPVVVQSCQRVLRERGYEVETTQSGREGMNRALAQRFDLVVTDQRMPDVDGMYLVRALRLERPETAVIIITGYGDIPSAVEATKLGVADYLEKPFTPEEITAAAGRALAAAPEAPGPKIEADLVRKALRRAAAEERFGTALLHQGSRVLSGLGLSPEAEAAIVSGDIAWIEKRCGELSAEEREWLRRRLEAEIW
jgi:DNA-binding NtrC family response regulator